MNKQDRAFTGWLNHLLMPYTPEYLRAASEGDTSAALSDLRLAARVQGAMAACYRWVGGVVLSAKPGFMGAVLEMAAEVSGLLLWG